MKKHLEFNPHCPYLCTPNFIVMSRVCDLTGKKALAGNNVSHSNRRTKRRFHANLQDKRFYIPETGEWITLRVSTSAIRTISKIGITEAINRVFKKGSI